MEHPPAPTNATRWILIVDEDRRMAHAYKRILKRAGYAVVDASNASEGIRHLDAEQIGLVITDIRMPGVGGAPLIRALKARGQAFIAISGNITAEVIKAATECGALAMLEKPVDVDELLAHIGAIIGYP
jgi:two-component system C4-dicarboxylate transport response regulator DctD